MPIEYLVKQEQSAVSGVGITLKDCCWVCSKSSLFLSVISTFAASLAYMLLYKVWSDLVVTGLVGSVPVEMPVNGRGVPDAFHKEAIFAK